MIDLKNLLSTLPPGPPPQAPATPPPPAPVMPIPPPVEPIHPPLTPAPEPVTETPSTPVETPLTATNREISAGEAPQNQTETIHPDKTPDIEPQEPTKAHGGSRKGSGRPRKGTKGTFKAPVIVSSNLPEEAIGSDLTEIHQNAFDVVEGLDNVDAVMAANAPALVTDAYKRAARAGTSKDPLDRVTYLALLAKATPQAKRQVAKQTDPASAKAELAILNRIIAGESIEDVQFTEREREAPDVQDGEVVG